jgi:transposase
MLDEGCSLEEMGRRVGLHASTVSYWLNQHGLRAGLREKHAPRGGIPKEQLAALVDRGLSVRQISDEVGMSASTVRHWLRRHELLTARARQPRTALTGEQFLAVCTVHGETIFQVRVGGSRRCLKCRSEAVMRRRRRMKEIRVAEAGGRCVLCGYDRYLGGLEFHHLDPSTKEFSLGAAGVTRSIERARAEARKCVLLCATCHAEVEGGVASLDARLAPPRAA